jgi:hypothetical protein
MNTRKLLLSAALLALVSSAVAQSLTGKPEDNKLAARTGTFYVNPAPVTTPPDNLNNGSTESLGVAIANNGNVIIGWEDDGDGLTDFESVWTLYDPAGNAITTNVDITSLDPAYVGTTINSKFMSYFRADKSPTPGRTAWGPKIKASLFDGGIGMGASSWDLGKEVAAFAAYTDSGEDDYPAVQVLTSDGKPVAIVAGTDSAYVQDSGSIRIADWDFLANGNIVIVGESRQEADLVNKYGGAANGQHAIYRIVDQTGKEIKATSLVSATTDPNQIWHGVGVTANGFAVRFNQGGRTTVRLFDNGGNPVSTNLDLGTLTGKEIVAAGGRGEDVGFHGNAKDAYVYVNTGTDDTGAIQVWVTVLSTNGTIKYSKPLTDDVKLAKVGGVDGALDASGRVFGVWSATIQDDVVPALVMGRALDATGKPVGGSFYISEKDEETVAAAYESSDPRATVQGDAFAVVWVSKNQIDTAGTGVVAARLFGQQYEPGSIESVGIKRIVPDTPMVLPELAAIGNWEPYTSVLGNSTFLIEGNTFAEGTSDMQRYVVAFQPAAGGAMKLGEVFYSDDAKPYKGPINLSRQNGNPGRVAGDKRPGAVSIMTGGEASPHGYPDLFNSDHRWDLGFDRLSDGRYATVQTFKVDPVTLTQTMLSKAQDSANGRRTSGDPQGNNQISRFGGELACLDNGNFVSVVEDRTKILNPDGNCATATIFAPDGSVVKESFNVANGDLWSNATAYRGGFAVRVSGVIYFFDNAGNLQGQVNQSTAGRSFQTGRGDETRIASHINSPYVFLAGSPAGAKLVSLAVWDSRDQSFVAVADVSEAGFAATTDRACLAVDALDRVVVAWESQPTGFEQPQTAARVMAFDAATKSIKPITASFWPFINVAKTGGIRAYRMNVSMTTRQILVAAKGEINLSNKPELGKETCPTEVNFYTVISHPVPVDDPTTPVGGAAPALKITKTSATAVVISWDASATGWTLESKTKLSDSSWTSVGTANPMAVTISGEAMYYRLRK